MDDAEQPDVIGRPRKPDPERYCLYCGTRLRRRYHRYGLEGLGVFMRRKYCNRACMGRQFSLDRTKEE